jgi:hypothetical protein
MNIGGSILICSIDFRRSWGRDSSSFMFYFISFWRRINILINIFKILVILFDFMLFLRIILLNLYLIALVCIVTTIQIPLITQRQSYLARPIHLRFIVRHPECFPIHIHKFLYFYGKGFSSGFTLEYLPQRIKNFILDKLPISHINPMFPAYPISQ